ncbi:DUF3991 domain-containing protein [uncultured Tyzzerella sp.]|uniref:DUF3991 domain-containing protein n=1 Tax=uncultured Tyzzerella sp. TaxID=2321398 RepID=UPI0029431491|nr:DUF3991 domain-containing protein [uncultured Tyzzerella sp.]
MAGFTQEQYKKASETNILDYLISNGYNIKKVGANEYTLEEHDSMRINPLKNNFFWNSRNVGGSTIQFLQYYEGKSFVDAVKILSGEQVSPTITNRPKYTPKIEEKGELILPEKNEDNKRAIAYLTKSRKLDFEIVNSLIKSGNIYESKDKHNVVFLGKDNENNVKYAMQRSTLTESTYKGDCENSDKNFGFRINSQNNCDKVCVFESAIDLMTHATISKHLGKDWKDINRVSLGCLSFKAMDNFLKDNNHIKEINLFLDNDEAGQENAQKFYNQYKDNYKINIIQVKSKDLNQTWQDYLKDKELNNNIKISGYLKCLNSPFVLPKKLENSNLKQYLKNMLDDFEEKQNIENIESIFKNELIFESEDNKAILVCKDEKGENVGGYKWDIYNKDFTLKPLQNSKEEPIYFKSISEESDCIMVFDDIVSPIYLMKTVNTAYVSGVENLENIDKLINSNKKVKNIVLFSTDKDFQNNFKDENSEIYKAIKNKADKYGIEIKVEEWEEDCYKSFLKQNFFQDKFQLSEQGDNEELYCFLRKNTNIPKEKLLKAFKNNDIYQDIDRNMIFVAKNEQGENIGGYKWDIYSKSENLILIPNSNMSQKQQDDISGFAKKIYSQVYKSLEIQEETSLET